MCFSTAIESHTKSGISLLIVIFLCASFSAAQEKPVQSQTVIFPRIGRVEITTWEKDKDVPRIVFRKATTKGLLREIKYSEVNDGDEWWKIDKSRVNSNPSIHFRILRFQQMSSPVVFVTGVFMGGSDGTLQTYLVADVEGRLRVINTSRFVNAYQGGTFVGNLGRNFGFGAVVWNFVWQDGYAHYADHPYDIEIYSFNKKTNEFYLTRKLQTKRLYYYGTNPTGPLREFGISGRDLLETLSGLKDRRTW